MSVDKLLSQYESKKSIIRKRLKEFKQVLDQPEDRILAELCFCICTPQSKAKQCWKAVKNLYSSGILFIGDENQIRFRLKGVRFPNNKSKFIFACRSIPIKEKIDSIKDPFKLREWLVENVKGIGWKEASHFLRNIGLGDEFVILDTHVQKNLKRFHIINEVKPNLTKRKYLEMEEKMREFSRKIGIPLAELDLLFWSNETGEVFK